MDAQAKKEVITANAINENDTGSAYVQVAILTARINSLSEHLKANKKDKHGQRGLQIMNGRRRRLLKYIERNDYDGYIALTDKLGIRRGQRIVR